MSVVARGRARIQHAETGVIYEIEPDELDWQELAAHERQMGIELGYFAQLEHPNLGPLTWEFWEYPIGAENDRDVNVGPHRLLENFELYLLPPIEENEADDDADGELTEDQRDRVEALVNWFFERYEDPAHRTSYITAEGGYLWNHGGPHDARDELGNAFVDEDEVVIDGAVAEIESNGISDWAPRPGYGVDDEVPEAALSDRFEEEANEVAEALALALNETPEASSGPIYGVAGGRIDLLGWSDQDNKGSGELAFLPDLRADAGDLVAALEGTNVHPDLLHEALRYLAVVALEGPAVTLLYARGVRLENVAKSVELEVSRENRPPLEAAARAALYTLLTLHATAIMSNSEGVRLVQQEEAYRRRPEDLDAARIAAHRLAGAVEKAQDLFGPAARAAIRDAADAIGAEPNPPRSTQVATWHLGGLLGAVGLVVKATAGTVILGLINEGLIHSAPGSAAVAGAIMLINSAFEFLVSQAPYLKTLGVVLGGDLAWLRSAADGLEWVRRKRS